MNQPYGSETILVTTEDINNLMKVQLYLMELETMLNILIREEQAV